MSRIAYASGPRNYAPADSEAFQSLASYVARRRRAGDTIEVESYPYRTSIYTRAILVVNGRRRRMWREGGGWRYA